MKLWRLKVNMGHAYKWAIDFTNFINFLYFLFHLLSSPSRELLPFSPGFSALQGFEKLNRFLGGKLKDKKRRRRKVKKKIPIDKTDRESSAWQKKNKKNRHVLSLGCASQRKIKGLGIGFQSFKSSNCSAALCFPLHRETRFKYSFSLRAAKDKMPVLSSEQC